MHELMWNAVGYAATAGAALVTLVGLYVLVPALHQRWFPLPRLRPGWWTGHEVFLAICIAFGLPLIIVDALFQIGFFVPLIGPPPDLDPPNSGFKLYLERCSVISSPLMLTLILGLLFAVMFARTGSRPHHYGLTWGRWPANLALGLLAFMITTPIVLAVFALSALILPTRLHQLTVLGKHHPPWWEWILIGFQATVAAPLLEEILMRGILQGWLRRASLTGHLGLLTFSILLVSHDLVQYDTAEEAWAFNEQKALPLLFTIVLAAGYGWWMYRLARRFNLHHTEIQRWQPQPSVPPLDGSTLPEEQASEMRRQARERDEVRSRRWSQANALLAIYGSAMLFAVMHSAWPAPIALFLLGLVLAWLSYRTQSLLGPITLHATFNFVAFIALYGSVLSPPEQNGNAQTTAVRPSVVGSIASSVPASQLPLRK
jgi:membrane protease YdiL (CAAX protease family)